MKSRCILVSLAFLIVVETTSASTIKYDGPWKWNDIDVKTSTEIGDNGYPVTVKYTGTIAISGYNSSADVSTLEIPEKITWRAEEWGDNVLTYGDHLLLSVVTYDFDVVAIADGAFYKSGIRGLVIPDCCKTIGAKAFYESANLERLVLGNGLMNIGKLAFYGCGSAPSASKMSLVIPPSIRVIGNWAFAQMDNVTNLVVQGISKVCWRQFQYTTNLFSLSFGPGVREIEDSFYYT